MSRPTRAEIDLTALAFNLKAIRSRVATGTKVLAVVKANAYGHGAATAARTLEDAGVEWFGVATVEEGLELREARIARPILLLGGVSKGSEDTVIANRLTPAVFDLERAAALSASAARRRQEVAVHLKVDTGMTRLGVDPDAVKGFVQSLLKLPGLQLDGIFSHLAQADLADPEVTEGQERRFRESVAAARSVAGVPASLLTHLANSAGCVARGNMGWEMVRPGIMLYGAYPAERLKKEIPLRPVLSLASEVLTVKDVSSGRGISYGWTFVTRRPSRIATVPVGYADGYPRALSNRAHVLIRGKRAPVAGAVCMDILMVDCTDIPSVQAGDRVTLIGRDGDETIHVEELATLAGLIPYELLCGISARVPRVPLELSS